MKKPLVLIALLLTSACTPVESIEIEPTGAPAEQETPTLEPAEPLPTENENLSINPVEIVRAAVAEMRGLSLDEITVLEVMEVTFRDGCLELGQAYESCLSALTPGYRVHFQLPDGDAWYHLDQTGAIFREAGPDFTPMPGSGE